MKTQSLFAVTLVSLATLLGFFAGAAEPGDGGTALKPLPAMQKEADRASDLVHVGDYQAAEKVYKDLSEHFPDSAFAFYELGRCRFTQQKYKLAVEAFTRAAVLAPSEAAPLEYLGRIYHDVGDLDAAVDVYQRALAITPDDKRLKKDLDLVTFDQAQKKPTTASFNDEEKNSPWDYRLDPNSDSSLRLENILPDRLSILNAITLEPDSPNLPTAVRLPSALRGEPLFVIDHRVWPVGDFLTPLEQSRLVIPPSRRVR
jgi:tetratricopeptide (TPR) repeat protein